MATNCTTLCVNLLLICVLGEQHRIFRFCKMVERFHGELKSLLLDNVEETGKELGHGAYVICK